MLNALDVTPEGELGVPRSTVLLAFAAVLCLLGRPTHADGSDFETGVIAYQSNKYLEALSAFHGRAERGHAGAEFMLGVMYFYGKGVARDDGLAAIWFSKAADKGHAGAQLAYGSLHVRGIGVSQNLSDAYKWLSLAASSGISGLELQAIVLRADAARSMKPTDIQGAQRRAQDWKPTRAGLVILE